MTTRKTKRIAAGDSHYAIEEIEKKLGVIDDKLTAFCQTVAKMNQVLESQRNQELSSFKMEVASDEYNMPGGMP